MKKYILHLIFHLLACCAFAQSQTGTLAPKPLYRDPVYDGAADPTLICNPAQKKWLMFYTNRRATDTRDTGVAWVHGTNIGIAESVDGAHWKYKGIANISYKPDSALLPIGHPKLWPIRASITCILPMCPEFSATGTIHGILPISPAKIF